MSMLNFYINRAGGNLWQTEKHSGSGQRRAVENVKMFFCLQRPHRIAMAPRVFRRIQKARMKKAVQSPEFPDLRSAATIRAPAVTAKNTKNAASANQRRSGLD